MVETVDVETCVWDITVPRTTFYEEVPELRGGGSTTGQPAAFVKCQHTLLMSVFWDAYPFQ